MDNKLVVPQGIKALREAQDPNQEPTSEPILFLTSAPEIKQIIKDAIAPYLKEIETLREEVALERAKDRKRIAALEQTEPQRLQKDHGKTLLAILADNHGKMFAKDARKQMHLSEPAFSLLLKTHSKEIEVKSYSADRRKNVILLK
jgi:hypothetical protein